MPGKLHTTQSPKLLNKEAPEGPRSFTCLFGKPKIAEVPSQEPTHVTACTYRVDVYSCIYREYALEFGCLVRGRRHDPNLKPCEDAAHRSSRRLAACCVTVLLFVVLLVHTHHPAHRDLGTCCVDVLSQVSA